MMTISCPNCDKGNVTFSMERDSFPYKSPTEGIIRLHYTAPMYYCPDCQMKFTDEAGEEARTQAVKAYLAGSTGAD